MSDSDISLEPLLNQSSEGSGASKRLAFVPVNAVGQADHNAANTITSTPEEITISAGKRTLEMCNTGSNVIYYGGAGVDSDNGIPLYPQTVKVFANVKDDFSVYVVCASGQTSTLRTVEYD